MRDFARDLDMTASALSEVLREKKGLSKQKAQKIAVFLRLSRRERDLFVLSVEARHSRSRKRRLQAQERLDHLMSTTSTNAVINDDVISSQAWFYNSILELTGHGECTHTVEWFAKKLQLQTKPVMDAIEQMTQAGWLKFEDGQYKSLIGIQETDFETPSDSTRALHLQHLKKSEEALFKQDVSARDFQVLTLAFDKSKYESAKDAIRNFQSDFARTFSTNQSAKNSVYQLAIQLVRLDQDGSSDK